MTTTKKEALLEAAKELFGEYGYADTTFKKISERAGVALGLLTHHYGNKEKLFLAAGLDVLDNFLVELRNAVAATDNGHDAVIAFAEAYLNYSITPNTNWMVLVRCSPYSDMKTKTDRDVMYDKFNLVSRLLEQQITRGIADGTIKAISAHETAQTIIALMVGVNRTRLLTPYAPPQLYEEAVEFISRSSKI